MQIKADIANVAIYAEAQNRHHDLADFAGLLWEHIGDFAGNHSADDVVARDIGAGMGGDVGVVVKGRKRIRMSNRSAILG